MGQAVEWGEANRYLRPSIFCPQTRLCRLNNPRRLPLHLPAASLNLTCNARNPTLIVQVATWYTLVIYTASMPEYADPVIDWLDAGRSLFAKRLYRDSCFLQSNGSYIKDLALVEKDLSRVCFMDNSPVSYAWNKGEFCLSSRQSRLLPRDFGRRGKWGSSLKTRGRGMYWLVHPGEPMASRFRPLQQTRNEGGC